VAARAVCISLTTGSLGDEVGRLVSTELGFRYVNDEIVAKAAARENIDPELVADVERRKSLIERLLGQLALSGGAAYMAPPPDEVSGKSDQYRALIRDVIEESAAHGQVVIVSHAASFALAGQDDVLRVFVTASPEVRARRVAEARRIDEEQAREAVDESDEARADYLDRFYEIDRELPTHYDVVVNTDILTVDQAAAIVAGAAKG
jgi:hypothetical protein